MAVDILGVSTSTSMLIGISSNASSTVREVGEVWDTPPVEVSPMYCCCCGSSTIGYTRSNSDSRDRFRDKSYRRRFGEWYTRGGEHCEDDAWEEWESPSESSSSASLRFNVGIHGCENG